jgi:hypothetical protein
MLLLGALHVAGRLSADMQAETLHDMWCEGGVLCRAPDVHMTCGFLTNHCILYNA